MNILLINHYAGAPQYGMEYRPYYLGGGMGQDGAQSSYNFSILLSFKKQTI